MGSAGAGPSAAIKPWIETPCLYSAALSTVAGCNIYLKLENLQPSGSFKSRGIGNLMVCAINRAKAATDGGRPKAVHFYCSSGGNAGLACATAARDLGNLPATIVVPVTTSAYMVGKLRAIGADVVQHGANWAAADAHLREVVVPQRPAGTEAIYVPPFDHPDVWAGAATLVDELAQQLPLLGASQPDAVVCSVGGGGLLCGIVEGVEKNWPSKKDDDNAEVPKSRVLAIETDGAHSLMASVKANELVTLPGITSVATSLGAVRVAEAAFRWWQTRPDLVVPAVVSDQAAVDAIVKFLDDTRILVEPACGASLAPVYSEVVTQDGKKASLLRQTLGAGLSDGQWKAKNVVIVVCGGSAINLDMLDGYRKQFGV